MTRAWEVLKGRIQETSGDRFNEIRAQKSWWESRGDDDDGGSQGERQEVHHFEGSCILWKGVGSCQGHEMTISMPLRDHSSKKNRGIIMSRLESHKEPWLGD